jgi:hypothetical protein
VEIAKQIAPNALLRELALKNYRFTSPEFLYYSIWVYDETFCGVFGDGPNGAYEWFIWKEKVGISLETSDCGYGSMTVALRDVLLKVEPLDA